MTKSIYLDTSVISALFDERTPERKRMTEEFWSVAGYEWFISTLVEEEISWAATEVRSKRQEVLKKFNVLTFSDECENLQMNTLKTTSFLGGIGVTHCTLP